VLEVVAWLGSVVLLVLLLLLVLLTASRRSLVEGP
jgi:hypothetical protein